MFHYITYFQPHTIVRSDFVLGMTPPEGICTIELLGLSTDKTDKLTFGNTSACQDFVGAS